MEAIYTPWLGYGRILWGVSFITLELACLELILTFIYEMEISILKGGLLHLLLQSEYYTGA